MFITFTKAGMERSVITETHTHASSLRSLHSDFCFVLYSVLLSPPLGVPNAPQTPNGL